jgi:hypothetical protein
MDLTLKLDKPDVQAVLAAHLEARFPGLKVKSWERCYISEIEVDMEEKRAPVQECLPLRGEGTD